MRPFGYLLLPCVLLAGIGMISTAQSAPVYRQVAGEIRRVVVDQGDSLLRLASRNSVSWRTLVAENGIENPDRIWPGQVFHVDTRRIVPALVEDGLVINIPEATLYVFEHGSLTARYPVGLGRPSRPTPIGSFTVLFGQVRADATEPTSLEEELQREDRVLVRKALPDPGQELGRHWIQLSLWGYGIHSTPFTSTVGQFLGEGCVRVARSDIEDIYRRVREGPRVEIVYQPVKLAVTPTGEVWVEAHPDVYGQERPGSTGLLEMVHTAGLDDSVDRQALEEVLAQQLGAARKVGSTAPRDGQEARANAEVRGTALWRCLDCPPGLNRRVTFQVEARVALDLPSPFPIEIRDDAGRVVFRPQMVAQTLVHLEPGETRNFVWEVRDTDGQPLPPGSYEAVIQFFRAGQGSAEKQALSLPLWLGN